MPIEEELGDGTMSPIGFDMDITRRSDPRGDSVALGMNGKFLPFKYYGTTGNQIVHGLKEEYEAGDARKLGAFSYKTRIW